MNPLKLWLNPWVLLALVAALLGVYGLGRTQGGTAGENRVQTRWDTADKQRRDQLDVDNENSRLAGKALATADEKRKVEDAKRIEVLDGRIAALTDQLSKRPARPAAGVPVARTADVVAEGGGTGTGLYRDDAVLLARKADLFQRIRLQRDECYAAYNDARETLMGLSLSALTSGGSALSSAPAAAASP